MQLPKAIKMMAGRYLHRHGWRKDPGGADLHTAMSRRSDVNVETVIDVGASNGCWSEAMMRHFPLAQYLLIEAQRSAHEAALKGFRATHPNARYELCAAGDREGEVNFHAALPLGGVASETPFMENNVTVPMKTVDNLVQQNNFRGPFLLKLDTHGFEVPILEGASQVLLQTSMLIIEAYNFTLCPGTLRFYELSAYLERRGFRCVDMFDLMVRPFDNAFWQMDMVFLPSVHPVFRIN